MEQMERDLEVANLEIARLEKENMGLQVAAREVKVTRSTPAISTTSAILAAHITNPGQTFLSY